jgi:uncharacterized protein (TIGR00297 family)
MHRQEDSGYDVVRDDDVVGMNFLPDWLTIVAQYFTTIGFIVAFAFCAWAMRAVTAGAALTGTLLSVAFCFAAGPAGLVPIVAVFLVTSLSTRIGRRKKERIGTSERQRGRGALQILANVGVAAICVAPLLYAEHARYILLAGACAALAEAAGDTVSSELGQAFGGRPRLITTFRLVGTGQDGAVTIVGTAFSIVAILIVCFACKWCDLLVPRFVPIVLAAAFLGTIVDSILGATLERPGRLGNNAVNFTSTAFSAALTIAIVFAHRWA